jgi:hypothetical protein
MTSRLKLVTATTMIALLHAASSQAGVVAITVEADGKTLSIDAKDATIEEILTKLNDTKPFVIERIGTIADTKSANRQLSGQTRVVLERLLENENHLIYTNVRTREVERLVVYGAPATNETSSNQPQHVASPAPTRSAPETAKSPDPQDQLTAAIDRATKDAEAAASNPQINTDQQSSRAPRGTSSMRGTAVRGRRGT